MSLTTNENSNKSILKRITAFGGVQIFTILVNLLRGKFVAIILGPAGMGISSLFTSASTTIQQLGSLGVNLSIVKEVAVSGKSESSAGVMAVAKRLILLTALLGAALCMVLSPLLSEWTFGSTDYTWQFIILGLAVGLSIAGAGYLAILQGLGEVKRLSKASVIGSLTGLFCGVPLYYFFGTSGIVPAMIILALATFAFYYFSFRNSSQIQPAKFVWNDHKHIIGRLISLGMVFMLGALVGSATNYLINAYVRYAGSLEDVGLFQAANSMTNQYIGIVFSALAMDYFPRISSVSNDSFQLKDTINRQAEIVILIATPLILLLMALAPLAIRILLAEDFMQIAPLIRWLAMGVLMQAVTFPLGYVFIAKDNKKAYIWLEVVIANVLWIACSVIFYYIFGLIGLGISLVVRTGIDIIISYLMCRHFYQFSYTPRVVTTIVGCLALGIIGFISSLYESQVNIAIMWASAGIAIFICLLRLRKLVKE